MTNRIVATIFIFICSAIAWAILGSTIFVRTDTASAALNGHVESIWGSAQVQSPPMATYVRGDGNAAGGALDGRVVSSVEEKHTNIQLPIDASLVNVDVAVDYRQRGLLWYSTYRVSFSGGYTFRNSTDTSQDVTFCFPLPAKQAIYDDVRMTANNQPLQLTTTNGVLSGRATVAAGNKVVLQVSYRSQGLDTWRYKLGDEVAEVNNFSLTIRTHFGGFDFPENTLSPTEERKSGDGWELKWDYRSLLSGFQIGMTMPEKIQPGPLAGRISYFAPVSLLFFFFVVFILTMLRGIEFHPMNYFFLACAFFAFHLLLAYLVDHISIHWAFMICSAVSLFLVWSYLRLVVGTRFAMEAGGAQFAYLILFSYAFFFQGFTGLTITIGAILTLFIAMQATAKTRWTEKFARKPA
ncbi:MAG TPA: inner membrane CreD family protein [Candidatus Dormibacteraeota bacterium]|nr:inner membrane CreD family protein [Candidatus Dormibacteraeota bacterium]